MAILITGGTGFLGVSLARRLLERGEKVVLFARSSHLDRISDIKDEITLIQGDLKVWPEVMNAVRDNDIKDIFHFGAMLSTPSEQNPWAAYETNVRGTMHALEAARLFGVNRFIFSSSASVFGHGIGDTVTDDTLQRPGNLYGLHKLYVELLGRFYRRKFNLDFRSLRYAGVIGPGATNIMVNQFNSWMIENAALGKPYECYGTPDIQSPVTYFKDAIRAAEMLYYAPKEKIKTINYNVIGVSPGEKVSDLEKAIKKFIPEAIITYKPDPATMEFFASYPVRIIDDSRASEEWGWTRQYTSFEKIVEDFIYEVRNNPKLYGL
jgi:nucleoside-diphosphate-sugar epimerase